MTKDYQEILNEVQIFAAEIQKTYNSGKRYEPVEALRRITNLRFDSITAPFTPAEHTYLTTLLDSLDTALRSITQERWLKSFPK